MRRRRDSNSRDLSAYSLSKRAHSTTMRRLRSLCYSTKLIILFYTQRHSPNIAIYRYIRRMAHVGKETLKPSIRSEIEDQFVLLISQHENGTGSKLLCELLTETEHLMLAKRLATILMLAEDFSYYRIYVTLGVSVSTSKRLHQQLIGGAFRHPPSAKCNINNFFPCLGPSGSARQKERNGKWVPRRMIRSW